MKSILNLFVLVVCTATFAQAPIGQPQTIETKTTGCISGDCNNGWGKWQFDNGYYDGFWVDGNKHGYGLYSWDESGIYVGFWNNDTMEGYGSYENQDKKIMRGMYANGKLNGLGEESTVDGNWNQGFYKEHSLTTPYAYDNNYLDVGCKVGECKNDYGQYKWENGDFFTGFFKGGKPHLGSYTFVNGDKYFGMFNLQGQFHGQGRFFYNDNSYYGGDFSNGQFHGKGYYHGPDYKTKIGKWEYGKLVRAL